VIFAAILGASFFAFEKWPTSYVPEEDMGYFMTSVELPVGASLSRTDSVVRHLTAAIEQQLANGCHNIGIGAGQGF
jgi:multidrug efflux pump subunit AcrB